LQRRTQSGHRGFLGSDQHDCAKPRGATLEISYLAGGDVQDAGEVTFAIGELNRRCLTAGPTA
jgi:hypothetical protein